MSAARSGGGRALAASAAPEQRWPSAPREFTGGGLLSAGKDSCGNGRLGLFAGPRRAYNLLWGGGMLCAPCGRSERKRAGGEARLFKCVEDGPCG